MSDLSATNCGCNNGCGNRFGNNSCVWIILILLFCCNGNNGFGVGGDCDNNGCSCIIIILLLLSCCGGNSLGFGGC